MQPTAPRSSLTRADEIFGKGSAPRADLMDELGDRVCEHPQLIGETETLEGHDRQVRLESG
jgi:hypothetical protein